LSADQSLTLPDYSVRQHTFTQNYNIFTKFPTRDYLIQSYDVVHPSIRLACKLDKATFFAQEKEFRSAHHYPPYGELCLIKYNNENENSLHNGIQNLNKELHYLQDTYEYTDISIYTSSPLIYKKFGKYYYHIILIGHSVRPFMDIAFSKLSMARR
jgi:primosomal protein N'